MHYVYILISKVDPSKYYVGITQNIKKRLAEHNENPSCSYTTKYKPWNLTTLISFSDKRKATNF
ncbi:MAG TPA: GIY-YIG nuclease family protein [Candidatus Omnitrophota bacterium]|nr:GIY-YIG nuclease family protein [Candidatus Omnitrophota bacterium]HPD84857.1 GIY-YIG nuclease family protein [Candidatus Omnitrophota bacterium]HRZ03715.1 GIY-YIG nuclease family protein [Candidatus Omnitrophota bacterium]